MPTLDGERKINWLYDHFQGSAVASGRLAKVYCVLVVAALAVSLSNTDFFTLPIILIPLGRVLMLGLLVASASFVLVGFFGSYDEAERTLRELSKAMACEPEDLWLIDREPSIFDFALTSARGIAGKSSAYGRAAHDLSRPLALIVCLMILGVILVRTWWSAARSHHMSVLDAFVYIIALALMLWSAQRAGEHVWRSFRKHFKGVG
jgi:hypothetical protein